jgi:hypothetical protein
MDRREPEPEPEPEPRSPSPRRSTAARSPSRVRRVGRARARGQRSPVSTDGMRDEVARTRTMLAAREQSVQETIAASAQEHAAVQIQAIYRGERGRMDAQLAQEVEAEDAAAVRIQAAFRGRQGRQQAEDQIEVEWQQMLEDQRKMRVEQDAEAEVHRLEQDMVLLLQQDQQSPRAELQPEPRARSPVSLDPRRRLQAQERQTRSSASKAAAAQRRAAESPRPVEYDEPPLAVPIHERLSDASTFTATHKHRFDRTGKGRGLDGRDVTAKGRGTHSIAAISPVHDVSQLFRPQVRSNTAFAGDRALSKTKSASPARSPARRRAVSPRRSSSTSNTQVRQEEDQPPPLSAGVLPVPAATGIFAKLTDPTQFTGAHRHRFDAAGKGRGLAGRDVAPKGSGSSFSSTLHLQDGVVSTDLSAMLRPGLQGGTGRFSSRPSRPPGQRSPRGSSPREDRSMPSAVEFQAQGSPTLPRRNGGGGGGGGGGAIYEKLTDSSQFTGSHKHRFDANGKGRGQKGRDRAVKGPGTGNASLTYDATEGRVQSLAQILRCGGHIHDASCGCEPSTIIRNPFAL